MMTWVRVYCNNYYRIRIIYARSAKRHFSIIIEGEGKTT